MTETQLDALTDKQLKFRFSLVAGWFYTPEVDAIVKELERRGYLYDPHYRDFLTCAEWNGRHGDWSPRDCSSQQ